MAKRRFRFDLGALNELDAILTISQKKFHELGRMRYQELIVQAARDVAGDIERNDIDWLNERGRRIGIYHLRHSRSGIPDPLGQVKNPPHALVVEIAGDGAVVILGFLHDRMLRRRGLRRILRRSSE